MRVQTPMMFYHWRRKCTEMERRGKSLFPSLERTITLVASVQRSHVSMLQRRLSSDPTFTFSSLNPKQSPLLLNRVLFKHASVS